MKQQETVTKGKDVDLGYPASAYPYFNGSSDQIDIPYSLDLNPTSFTVEMWVQFQGGSGYRAILSSVNGSASVGRRGYVFCINPAQYWQFWLGSGHKGIPWIIITGPKAQEGVWTHIAGTYDSLSQTMILYVNGQLVGKYEEIPFQPNDRHPLHVGAGATEQPGASSCFFHGSITKIRIWEKSLSSAEIQTLASSPSPGVRETPFMVIPPSAAQLEPPTTPTLQVPPTPSAELPPPSVSTPEIVISPLQQPQLNEPNPYVLPTSSFFIEQTGEKGTPQVTATELNQHQPSPTSSPQPEQTGATKPEKSTASGASGHIPSMQPKQSLIQSVLAFDGQDDYIEIPYSSALDFAPDRDFTIEVWLKPDPVQEGEGKATFDINVLEKWTGTPFPYAIRYSSKNGRVYASRYDGKKHPAISSLQPINDRQFHHVAFVKQSSHLYLYVDGVEATSANDTTIETTQNNSPLYLCRGAGGRNFFKGQIAEFRIWNRARSLVEIQAHMSRRLVGNEASLVGYWSLNEGTGSVAHDLTNNANHGKIHEATWQQVEIPIN